MASLAVSSCAAPRASFLASAKHPAGGPSTAAFAIDGVVPAESRPSAHRPVVMALSGGGPDGAFGAGYIAGRARTGEPPADVITGVSTGALIAPFAFVGAGASLQNVLAGPALDALAADQNPISLLFGRSLATGDGLRALVASNISDRLIEAVAEEHRRGRRLYVTATDLDGMRGFAWDIGALAASGQADRVERIRKIIVASSSIPGAFPPVPLTTRETGTALFVDGGASAQFFVPRFASPSRPRRVTVIVNNRLDADPLLQRVSGVSAARRGFSTLIRAHTRAQIDTLRLRGRQEGFPVEVIALPPDWPAAGGIDFNPERIRATFRRGLAAAGASPDG